MPIFEDDIRIITREIKTSDDAGLPPLISLLITAISFIIALLIGLFFIYPFIIATFNIGVVLGFFLSLGCFILLHFGLAELLTKIFSRLKHRKGT